MLKIYIKNDCEFCAQLDSIEGLDAELINVDEGYVGYLPPQLPALQVGGMTIEGAPAINIILNVARNGKK